MSNDKKRRKARKKMSKILREAIECLEKAESHNLQWEFVPDEVFKEIVDVLGKIETKLEGLEA